MTCFAKRICVTTAVVLSLSSCFHSGADEEEMFQLASNLPAVSSAVDAYVNYGGAPAGLDGPELVREATANNPAMIAAFKDFFVTARRVGSHTSVLICDVEKNYALLEDTACTTELDAHWWKKKPPFDCTFALDLTEVCN